MNNININNKKKTQIFLQARMGSTRLPGKVLMKICNKTIVELTVERLRQVKNIDKIILVTSASKENDVLVKEAKKLNIDYFRGSEENLLDRFYNATLKFKPDNIIRITCDCPLIDPFLIKKGLDVYIKTKCDVVDNKHAESLYPHGSDFEIFKASLIKDMWRQKKRELSDKMFSLLSVGPTEDILRDKKNIIKKMHNKKNLAHIRLTLDYKEDLELIKIIYKNFYKDKHNFSMNDVLKFIEDNPTLLNINRKFVC